MTIGTSEQFRRQSEARFRKLKAETDGKPPKVETSTCMRCKRRTEVTRLGTLVTRVVHQDTGLISCQLPVDPKCGLCDVPGLMQCSAGGCGVMAHPSCLVPCNCDGRLYCPEHVRDGTCDSCRVHLEAKGLL